MLDLFSIPCGCETRRERSAVRSSTSPHRHRHRLEIHGGNGGGAAAERVATETEPQESFQPAGKAVHLALDKNPLRQRGHHTTTAGRPSDVTLVERREQASNLTGSASSRRVRLPVGAMPRTPIPLRAETASPRGAICWAAPSEVGTQLA